MRLGLGRLRLGPSSFYEMTVEELTLAAEGYAKEQEERERSEWERTRWLAALMLQPHAKKGRTIKPQDLAKFPWEKEAKKKTKTQPTQSERVAEGLLMAWATPKDGTKESPR
jgi:gentisate 1,2-dioxygenase